jgi:hypothetical protein
MAQNRIVTVRTVNVGTKKDSAEIGFQKGAGLTYLIFPKELPFAEGTKVIGLKFDMLDEAEVSDPVRIKETRHKAPRERVKTIKDEPEPEEEKPVAPPRFKVLIEYQATATKEIEVEAKNAVEAVRLATKSAKESPPENPKWEIEAQDVRKCES